MRLALRMSTWSGRWRSAIEHNPDESQQSSWMLDLRPGSQPNVGELAILTVRETGRMLDVAGIRTPSKRGHRLHNDKRYR